MKLDFSNLLQILPGVDAQYLHKFHTQKSRLSSVLLSPSYHWYSIEEEIKRNELSVLVGQDQIKFSVSIFAASEEDIKEIFKKIPILADGGRKELIFESLDTKYVETMKKVLREKGFSESDIHVSDYPTFVLFKEKLDDPKFHENLKILSHDVKPVSLEYVPLIVSKWVYASQFDFASKYIEYIIKSWPSSGFYNEKGELVGWALTHNDGSIGIVHTLDGYRKKGIAQKLVANHILKLQALKRPFFCHIDPKNEASIKLFTEKFGCVETEMVSWVIGVKIEKYGLNSCASSHSIVS